MAPRKAGKPPVQSGIAQPSRRKITVEPTFTQRSGGAFSLYHITPRAPALDPGGVVADRRPTTLKANRTIYTRAYSITSAAQFNSAEALKGDPLSDTALLEEFRNHTNRWNREPTALVSAAQTQTISDVSVSTLTADSTLETASLELAKSAGLTTATE